MSLQIAIRGAGAAGLSLARAILAQQPTASVALFDRRPRLPHPRRTFCFFRDQHAICPVPVAHEWNQVRFRGPHFDRIIDCSHTPYSMIRGVDFFGVTLTTLEAQGARLVWDCSHVELDPAGLATEGGLHRADVVVDAALDRSASHALLWQSFLGVWVETARPAFDPNVAVLMDLQESTPDLPLSFIYVLPTSPTTALVEHTAYHPFPLPRAWHRERCLRWLLEHSIAVAAEGDSEYGTIPLGLRLPPVVDGVPRIGSIGGAVRPSTGYAFQTIQRQAVELAGRILEGHPETPSAYPGWLRWADELFLQALTREPHRGLHLMEQLLAHAPAKELLLFLGGRANPLQSLRVMMHVPKMQMVHSLSLPAQHPRTLFCRTQTASGDLA
jgi:lycopene beta-cyclase